MTMIRTELYKLRTSKKFCRLLLIFSILNLVIMTLLLAFYEKLLSMAEVQMTEDQMPVKNLIMTVESALSSPFVITLMMVFMFISAVSFFSMDFKNGYVKNIAGQVRSKNSYVIAKLIAVAVHNLVFFVAGALTNIVSGVVTGRFEVGTDIAQGAATLLLKWLLSVALCAILLFFSVGVKNHTVSVIIGVVFSTNTLGLIYSGINYGVHELFKMKSFDITKVSPSSLLDTVSVVKGENVINAIVVSAVFVALFLYLTCMLFKKRDIH